MKNYIKIKRNDNLIGYHKNWSQAWVQNGDSCFFLSICNAPPSTLNLPTQTIVKVKHFFLLPRQKKATVLRSYVYSLKSVYLFVCPFFLLYLDCLQHPKNKQQATGKNSTTTMIATKSRSNFFYIFFIISNFLFKHLKILSYIGIHTNVMIKWRARTHHTMWDNDLHWNDRSIKLKKYKKN